MEVWTLSWPLAGIDCEVVAALAVLTAASADVVALDVSALRPELDKDGVGELVVVRVVEVGDEPVAFLAKPRRH